jgi:hypothetical protein
MSTTRRRREKEALPSLWRCQKCRREFPNRNQSHACGRSRLADHFQGKPPQIRALFDAVVAAIRSIGPVRILPEKTGIAFQVRMSFAQVTPRRLEHPRLRRTETFSPRNHMHVFRLSEPGEIDGDFRAWLAEAYRVGEQRHLPPRKKLPNEPAGRSPGNRGAAG